MQKIIYFLFCCLLSSAMFAQSIIYSNSFFEYDNIPCPFDNNQTVLYPKGWIVYQTLDDTWNGPVDSTRCISVESFGFPGKPRIDLEQIDPEKALFIRAKPSEFIGIGSLTPNYVFNVYTSSSISDIAVKPRLGTDCTEDLCTGVFVGIAVPGALRIQTGVTPGVNFEETVLDVVSCFPSEYFDSQHLDQVILKYTFGQNADMTGQYLYLDGVFIDVIDIAPGLITEVNAYPSQYNSGTGEYDVHASDIIPGFSENCVLQYTAPTFPSVQDPSYVIGTPVPNSTSQQTINLIIDPFQTLEIQPFTYLQGALVEGSDTQRHQANLVNNGGDICLNFIDFVVDGGDEFRHAGGSLYMNNAFSCMKFANGSALRVVEGATLHYGNDGTGMLALCANSTLAIERNATLVIDAVLNLSECNADLLPQQIYMDLPPGARLVFTDRARLTNRFSQGQLMKLNVRMLGGTIDDAALAPEDRALINRIYPDPAPNLADNMTLYPNPFAGSFTFGYLAGQQEKLNVRWADINGRTVLEQTLQAEKGYNEWQPQAPASAGVYMLTVETEKGKVTKKVVRTAP